MTNSFLKENKGKIVIIFLLLLLLFSLGSYLLPRDIVINEIVSFFNLNDFGFDCKSNNAKSPTYSF